MQINDNAIQTFVMDGVTFKSFNREGVFSVEYVEHLMKNHSIIEQNPDDEDERCIQLKAGFDIKLSVDCEAGSIQINSNIQDLIDKAGNSIASRYGLDALIIDMSCDCFATHH